MSVAPLFQTPADPAAWTLEGEARKIAASERRLVAALSGWAKNEIERLVNGRVRESRTKSVLICGPSGERSVEHTQSMLGGFASAEDAARALVDEATSQYRLTEPEGDTIVWRVFPELRCAKGLRPTWSYYWRGAFLTLGPGERIVVDEAA